MLFSALKRSPLTLAIIWGLILEFPVRYLISPDPWVHHNSHWYFHQPNRLLIELGFVLLAVLPFFWIKELKSLLSIKWTRNNLIYLLVGIIVSVLIFVSQQWEEIGMIQDHNLGQHIPIWFTTGLVIGVGQELTFRGLIYTGFLKKYGLKSAVLVSTFCFVIGSIHSVRMYICFMNDYMLETLLLLFIFILSGLFFVWIRIKTNNIIIPALIHGIGNAITWYSFVIVKLFVD